MPTLTITQVNAEHSFDVKLVDDSGIERIGTSLTQDEALWVAAQFLMGNTHRYLRTAEQHAAWEQRLKELREQNTEPGLTPLPPFITANTERTEQ